MGDLIDVSRHKIGGRQTVLNRTLWEIARVFPAAEALFGGRRDNLSVYETRAAAESCPCDMRYSGSSSPGQCAFLNGIEFSSPLSPRIIMVCRCPRVSAPVS